MGGAASMILCMDWSKAKLIGSVVPHMVDQIDVFREIRLVASRVATWALYKAEIDRVRAGVALLSFRIGDEYMRYFTRNQRNLWYVEPLTHPLFKNMTETLIKSDVDLKYFGLDNPNIDALYVYFMNGVTKKVIRHFLRSHDKYGLSIGFLTSQRKFVTENDYFSEWYRADMAHGQPVQGTLAVTLADYQTEFRRDPFNLITRPLSILDVPVKFRYVHGFDTSTPPLFNRKAFYENRVISTINVRYEWRVDVDTTSQLTDIQPNDITITRKDAVIANNRVQDRFGNLGDINFCITNFVIPPDNRSRGFGYYDGPDNNIQFHTFRTQPIRVWYSNKMITDVKVVPRIKS